MTSIEKLSKLYEKEFEKRKDGGWFQFGDKGVHVIYSLNPEGDRHLDCFVVDVDQIYTVDEYKNIVLKNLNLAQTTKLLDKVKKDSRRIQGL